MAAQPQSDRAVVKEPSRLTLCTHLALAGVGLPADTDTIPDGRVTDKLLAVKPDSCADELVGGVLAGLWCLVAPRAQEHPLSVHLQRPVDVRRVAHAPALEAAKSSFRGEVRYIVVTSASASSPPPRAPLDQFSHRIPLKLKLGEPPVTLASWGDLLGAFCTRPKCQKPNIGLVR